MSDIPTSDELIRLSCLAAEENLSAEDSDKIAGILTTLAEATKGEPSQYIASELSFVNGQPKLTTVTCNDFGALNPEYADWQRNGRLRAELRVKELEELYSEPRGPFKNKPSECKHESTTLMCNDCGINFRNGSVPLAQENEQLKQQLAKSYHALKLALEYWANRQQRYKNRHPVWVQEAHEAIAQQGEV